MSVSLGQQLATGSPEGQHAHRAIFALHHFSILRSPVKDHSVHCLAAFIPSVALALSGKGNLSGFFSCFFRICHTAIDSLVGVRSIPRVLRLSVVI